LQNETTFLPTHTKVAFIEQLAACGLTHIEATSFVSPKKIPQLADHHDLLQHLTTDGPIHYPVLVPNLHGYQRAITAGAREVCFFTAASESFCQHNTQCSIATSLERLAAIMPLATAAKIPVRAYISCALGCPYEGDIKPAQVVTLARRLYALGVAEISLGDTLGCGTPHQCQQLFTAVAAVIPLQQLAAHFHNSYGQALANAFAVLELGVCTIDSAVAGLGGCPYATGAGDNLATEDLVYLLEGSGVKTGINLSQLVATAHFICNELGITPRSYVARAAQNSASSTAL
jgi:hydroxymethylglutaryl-CoA lyase